ncbi:MAG TPA: RluA family pseudouridine synthase [Leptospiraceae bacterium]|nr:RluA family pseudouridine synthase [Leptospiraceae bacterium]HMW07599.1 RluA family pseudouridine synthase [Leptospiraceae bacterium]HMX33023.1 RluA family pseudouridine synthase [Leptospiraceae bacterium]HMY33186.1 RluA family pseudouridine synthase [Leptospiraceae bacterium]HMZ66357.1 RluA family pseudouridine synthase [Leptospiraceae bacterium]
MIITVNVQEGQNDQRLDHFLAQSTGDEISRTSIQKWIKSGNVVNLSNPKESKLKANLKVQIGDIFQITIPPKPKLNLTPVEMKLEILHEEEDFVIIDKPAGIASHGGPGDDGPTLVNGLLFYFKNLSKLGGDIRPGIVHRLDKPTSGIMIIAKTDKAHIQFVKMFQKREIEKQYYAWLVQTPKLPTGRIELPLGRHPTERLKMCVRNDGRKAITNYQIEKSISSRKNRNYSLAKIQIETGRTHQIRVHFQSMGCPVVGDMLYSRTGNEFSQYGLLLFSQKIRFKHPFTKKIIDISLPFPERFTRFEKEAEFR